MSLLLRDGRQWPQFCELFKNRAHLESGDPIRHLFGCTWTLDFCMLRATTECTSGLFKKPLKRQVQGLRWKNCRAMVRRFLPRSHVDRASTMAALTLA